jgi:hypothetical protein
MTQCNRCTDPFELWEWKKIEDRWKLCNPYTGNPHACKNNVKPEISSDTKPTKEKSGRVWSPHVGEYTSGDMARPETNTLYSCDKCGSELGTKSFGLDGITNIDELNYLKKEAMTEYACNCLILNKIACDSFCSKCNNHPQVIQATSN